ncbi:Nucleolar pre-ribosomal-associated protein 1 [Trichinella pseudospiralis]|uniref:Nucleolar pre-ribosomal-associated protein 1 n=1 Tax=Trichinella pseudospiralis TaxID=6337 RepID=A0A0V1JEY2_TRIPS|nr:Nucleolar pre-ribosomal-associated protein 1 [Trichinella pseudospiralis]KRZ33530.1 Nucleolar pre-ribosomal-associated protein 1 [Trichinella pseudospiralis]
MKRRIDLFEKDDNFCEKQPKTSTTNEDFDARQFLSLLSRSNGLSSALSYFTDACNLFDQFRSAIDPVVELFQYSSACEELTNCLENVEKPVMISFLFEVFKLILERIVNSTSELLDRYGSRALVMFRAILNSSHKLYAQLKSPAVQQVSQAIHLLKAGVQLGPAAVEDLLCKFDFSRSAVVSLFRGKIFLSEMVTFFILLLKQQGAAVKLANEKFALKLFLTSLPDVEDLALLAQALDSVCDCFVNSEEISKVEKVKLFDLSTTKKLCQIFALFENNTTAQEMLQVSVEKFFSSCIMQMSVFDPKYGFGDQICNATLATVYRSILPFVSSNSTTAAAQKTLIRMIQTCPDLIAVCLNLKNCCPTNQAALNLLYIWQCIFEATADSLPSLCAGVIDANILSELVVPSLAMQWLVKRYLTGSNVHLTIAACKVLLKLFKRVDIVLEDEKINLKGEIKENFLHRFPTLDELLNLFTRTCKCQSEASEFLQITVELVCSAVCLYSRLHQHFLLCTDLIRIYSKMEAHMTTGQKLRLINKFADSCVDVKELAKHGKGARSVIGSLLECYDDADEQERQQLDDAFCSLCKLHQNLSNRLFEVRLWLHVLMHRYSVELKQWFEIVMRDVFINFYGQFEAMLQQSDVLSNLLELVQLPDDEFQQQLQQADQHRIENSLILHACLNSLRKSSSSSIATMEDRIFQAFRTVLWSQKGSWTDCLIILKNSDLSIGKKIVDEHQALLAEGKLNGKFELLQELGLNLNVTPADEMRNCMLDRIDSLREYDICQFLHLTYLWRLAEERKFASEQLLLELIERMLCRSREKRFVNFFFDLKPVQKHLYKYLFRKLHYTVDYMSLADCIGELDDRDAVQLLRRFLQKKKNKRTFNLQESAAFAALKPFLKTSTLLNVLNELDLNELNIRAFSIVWLELIERLIIHAEDAFRIDELPCATAFARLLDRVLGHPRRLTESICSLLAKMFDYFPLLNALKLKRLARTILQAVVIAIDRRELLLHLLQKLIHFDTGADVALLFCNWIIDKRAFAGTIRHSLLHVVLMVMDKAEKRHLDVIFQLYKSDFRTIQNCNEQLFDLAIQLASREYPLVEQLFQYACLVVNGNDVALWCSNKRTTTLVKLLPILQHVWSDSAVQLVDLLLDCMSNEERTEFESQLATLFSERVEAVVAEVPWEKLVRLAQLVLADRFDSVEHLILLESIVLRWPIRCRQAVPVVAMVFGHSQFGASVLFGENDQLKLAIVDLLYSCVQVEPTVVEQWHISVLLGAYRATLAPSDVRLLALIELYENCGVDLSAFYPLTWSAEALRFCVNWRKLGPSLWNRPSSDDVLNAIEADRMRRTVDQLPLNLSLDLHNVVDRRVHSSNDNNCALYDARFFLPLMLKLVSVDVELDCRKFATKHCLGLALTALSFNDCTLRAMAYKVLLDFQQRLDASCVEFYEKAQLNHVIDLVRASVEHENNERLPFLITLFFARATALLFEPTNQAYPVVNSFLLIRPFVDLHHVPNFLQLMYSSSEQHQQRTDERMWLLNLLADGIRTKVDYFACCRSMVFKHLLAYAGSTLCDQSTVLERVLDILLAASRVPLASASLCVERSLLLWLDWSKLVANTDASLRLLITVFPTCSRRRRLLVWWVSTTSRSVQRSTTVEANLVIQLVVHLVDASNRLPTLRVQLLDQAIRTSVGCVSSDRTLSRTLLLDCWSAIGRCFLRAFQHRKHCSDVLLSIFENYLLETYRNCSAGWASLSNLIVKLFSVCQQRQPLRKFCFKLQLLRRRLVHCK